MAPLGEATFFEAPSAFRSWLADNYDTCSELLVGYWKKATKLPSVTWEETVDEALCYGWIDGIRRRIDDQSFSVRFTPRRKDSIWSPRNLERVQALQKEGRMKPAGLAIWMARRADATDSYDAAREEVSFDEGQQAAFGDAWEFWVAQPPGYRRQWTRWVFAAKQEETRHRRLTSVIAASKAGVRVNAQRPYSHLEDGP